MIPVQRVTRALQPVGQAQAAHAVAKAVANQHTGYFVEAPHVTRGAQSLDQHDCMIALCPAGQSGAGNGSFYKENRALDHVEYA